MQFFLQVYSCSFFKVSYVLTDACELQYLVACRLGTKFEQNLSAAIRFQRLLERFLELVERVDMLHCGGERSISYEVAQLLVNILDLCSGRVAYPIDEPESVEAKTHGR